MRELLEDLWANIEEFFIDIQDKIEDAIDWIEEKFKK